MPATKSRRASSAAQISVCPKIVQRICRHNRRSYLRIGSFDPAHGGVVEEVARELHQ